MLAGRRRPDPATTPAPIAARTSAPLSFAELLRAHVQVNGGAAHDGGDAGGARGADAADGDGATETARWVDELVEAAHGRFRLAGDGHISCDGERLGRLGRGVDLLHPEVTIVSSRPLGAGARLRLGRRLIAWTRDRVSQLLAPLRAAGADLSPAARGIVYQLEQGLGTIPTAVAAAQLRALSSEDRAALRKLGVRVGRHVAFLPSLLAADTIAARVALCNAQLGRGQTLAPPRPGAPSMATDPDLPPAFYASIGYPAFGARAIRADLVDGIAARLLAGAHPADIASRLGCRIAAVGAVRDAFTGPRGDAPREGDGEGNDGGQRGRRYG